MDIDREEIAQKSLALHLEHQGKLAVIKMKVIAKALQNLPLTRFLRCAFIHQYLLEFMIMQST